MDNVRSDCDAKVKFLVKQLRNAEQQVRSSQTLARQSIEFMRRSADDRTVATVATHASSATAETEAYAAERLRREQLERRNGELIRELRRLKVQERN